MTTKTDLQNVTLINSELTACQGKAVNAQCIMAAVKQSATELAIEIGELIKVMPTGANKTTLITIQSNLL
jgi:hypothetical protein